MDVQTIKIKRIINKYLLKVTSSSRTKHKQLTNKTPIEYVILERRRSKTNGIRILNIDIIMI